MSAHCNTYACVYLYVIHIWYILHQPDCWVHTLRGFLRVNLLWWSVSTRHCTYVWYDLHTKFSFSFGNVQRNCVCNLCAQNIWTKPPGSNNLQENRGKSSKFAFWNPCPRILSNTLFNLLKPLKTTLTTWKPRKRKHCCTQFWRCNCKAIYIYMRKGSRLTGRQACKNSRPHNQVGNQLSFHPATH